MKKFHLAAVAALTMLGFASVASAADFKVTTSLNAMSYDIAGTDVETSALTFGFEGRFDNGIRLDGEVGYGEVSDYGLSVRNADVGLAWHYQGVAGPALRYMSTEFMGTKADMTMFGLSGEYSAGALDLKGELVSDVDNFGDIVLARVSADYHLSPLTTLTADLDHLKIKGGENSTLLNVGMEYQLSNSMFVAGGVTVGKAQGLDAKGVNLGLGFRF